MPGFLTFVVREPTVRQGHRAADVARRTYRPAANSARAEVARKERNVAQARALVKGMEPVPGYHLSQFLGRGGWGEVWKADHADGRGRALKFIPCDSQMAAGLEIRALQA